MVDAATNEHASRDVAARGCRIRVADVGEGPAVVLVHGLFADHRAWDAVVPAFAGRYRVVAPDLPGAGGSEKPPPARYAYDCEAFAESLVDVVAALGLARVSIVGHGLGAAIALTVAARHPAIVRRLVVASVPAYGMRRGPLLRAAASPFFGAFAFKQLLGRSAFRSLFEDDFHGFQPTVTTGLPPADASAASALADAYYDAFNTPAGREAAYATLQGSLDVRPIVALLPRVSAPTLVVAGRGDRLVPAASARRLARTLARARFEVLECGHAPHAERPATFAAQALAFLGGDA